MLKIFIIFNSMKWFMPVGSGIDQDQIGILLQAGGLKFNIEGDMKILPDVLGRNL